MNYEYIEKLFEKKRVGLIIKLIKDSVYVWSVDDYRYFYRDFILSKQYDAYFIYKYMMLNFSPSNKDIIQILHDNKWKKFISNLTYHKHKYKDDDYNKMLQYRYTLCTFNYSYDNMRHMNEYLNPFQRDKRSFLYDKDYVKNLKFAFSPKFVNANGYTYFSDIAGTAERNLIVKFFIKNLKNCDNNMFTIERYLKILQKN